LIFAKEWTIIKKGDKDVIRYVFYNNPYLVDSYTLEFCHMAHKWSYRLCPR